MGLADFFRPKWRHSDVAVRTAAIRALDAQETGILVQVVRNDTDDNVRKLALRKIVNPQTLAELAGADLDQNLRDLASERLSSLRVSTAVKDDAQSAQEALDHLEDENSLAEVAKRAEVLEVRHSALQRLKEPKSLADVARQAREKETRLAAVAAVDDPAVLRSLAISCDDREVALAALERVEDADHLRAIAKQAKIKGLRSRAQKKYRQRTKPAASASREESSARERQQHRQARLVRLIATLEQMTPALDDSSEDQRLDEIKAQWATLAAKEEALSPELVKRFEAACQNFLHEQQVVAARVAEQHARREQIEADNQRRQELCDDVACLSEEADDEQLEALRQQWEALGPELQPDGPWAGRFAKAIDNWRRTKARVQQRQKTRGNLEELADRAEELAEAKIDGRSRRRVDSMAQRWERLVQKAGVDDDLRERFEQALETFRRRQKEEQEELEQKQQENHLRLEALVTTLENLADTEDLKTADQALREARVAFKKPGPLPSKQAWNLLRDRQREASAALQQRVQALREAEDWKRLFNVPKKDELCRKAETLAEVEDLKEVATTVRALQREWKNTGPVPRGKSDELWTRFKTACDTAYERCGPYFASQKEERVANVAKKEAICEEAEGLAESTDWRETAEKLKQLQRDWKAIGPVERGKSDAVWKRFRAACDQFFERRKADQKKGDEQRVENLKAKEKLCEQAEAVAESSDWAETAERLKTLQAEWKAIGPVPRKQSDAVWGRFRAACDLFFERREAHQDGGRQANLQQKRQLCEDLRQVLAAEADDQGAAVAQKTLETWRDWKGIGAVPFDQEAPLDKELHELCRQAVDRYSDQFVDTELDGAANAKRAEKLLQTLQELAATADTGPATNDGGNGTETIAEQLQEAMERNTYRAEAETSERNRLHERVNQLLNRWRRMPPVARDVTEKLEPLFLQAYEQALGEPPPAPDQGTGRGKGRDRSGGRGKRRPRSGKKATAKTAAPAARNTAPEQQPPASTENSEKQAPATADEPPSPTEA
jgi:hypothetical protein